MIIVINRITNMVERLEDNQKVGLFYREKSDQNKILKFDIASHYRLGDQARYFIKRNDRQYFDFGTYSIKVEGIQYIIPELSSYFEE